MKKNTLQKFKKALEVRLGTLQGHIRAATDSLLELNHQPLKDQIDVISANSQGILNHSLLYQHEQELFDIKKSLDKIQKGEFGICEMCGDNIDEERLWIKPHAKYCIICREIYEKSL